MRGVPPEPLRRTAGDTCAPGGRPCGQGAIRRREPPSYPSSRRSLSHPRPRGGRPPGARSPPPAALPRPPRARAEFPPLLIVLRPAPPRPAPPPRPRGPGGGEGAGAGADGTGVAAAAGRAAAAQTPPATQPPAAPLPPGSAPRPGSAAAAARRGLRSATRESRVSARPSEPPPGLPERRPRSCRPAVRTLRQARSHLLRV